MKTLLSCWTIVLICLIWTSDLSSNEVQSEFTCINCINGIEVKAGQIWEWCDDNPFKKDPCYTLSITRVKDGWIEYYHCGSVYKERYSMNIYRLEGWELKNNCGH